MDAGRLVRGILASADLAAVLRFLNQRARFRFTGVYRTDPPLLRNVCLFDRENPDLMLGGDATPLERTYCGIVSSTRSPFYVEDAISDARVANHAARESVVSYAGVPLRSPTGHVVGTLCHFDVRPRVLPEHELDVLEAVAGAISSWLAERGVTLADPNASNPADARGVSRRGD
jgi:GAF domain-containing protein